jgi:preprotein translocase subunit SecE
MASKAALVNGGDQPLPKKRQSMKIVDNAVGTWNEFSRFLNDVRAEMRKVVTPSRKEVEATTTVVLVAVFIFGVFFWVVDTIFQNGLHQLLGKLGGF